MCEILVKAIDATHKDPVKDRAGCYKRGYPVVVMEDGHRWGREEGPPKFYVVKMPGVSVKDMQYICEEDTAIDPLSNELETVYRRKWKVDDARMPGSNLTEITDRGDTTMGQVDLEAALVRTGGR